jgi:hypothetical protein
LPIFAQHRKVIACKINLSLKTLNKIASLNMQTVTSKKIQSNLQELAKQKMVAWMYGRKGTAPISAITVSDDELNDLINKEIKK